MCPYAHGDVLPLTDALRATYVACVGIDDELSDLKKMAGINTAVTGVGTAAGVGATVTGLVKASKDKRAEDLEKKLEELKKLEQQGKLKQPTEDDYKEYVTGFEKYREYAIKSKDEYQTELDKLTKQSKSLGNWRTGLMAGSTATNIAGAIIAGGNQANADLETKIQNCITATNNLNQSIGQARADGLDVTEAQTIVRECREYEYVDLSKINNRARGAMISSIVGATTGVAGTVTSAVANSNKVRDDNTDAGRSKEKNLNTASNVLAGATTAASATATVFNATQIKAIKKVAAVAEKCTGVLKQ